ncbi:MAG: hypothetical protein LC674_01070 [Actinobacteria bacterium]|nr:hypothetical protein [Actinomycetota bacterium]
MGLLERILRERLRQRMYGGRRRQSSWLLLPPPRPRNRGYGIWGRPSRRPYYGRSRTHVQGCGCCLPLPLGLLSAAVLSLRLGLGRLRR